jgi:hypothetical protein
MGLSLATNCEVGNLASGSIWHNACSLSSCLEHSAETMNFLSAAHQLAWTQHPGIWLCESCAVLWLVLRKVRSLWVQTGVLSMLCGLMLNALVTDANAGTMPVVGMPSTLHPTSSLWQVATSNTRLPFLADQARLGLFSVGDIVLLFGGIVIVAICLQRTLQKRKRRPLFVTTPASARM